MRKDIKITWVREDRSENKRVGIRFIHNIITQADEGDDTIIESKAGNDKSNILTML